MSVSILRWTAIMALLCTWSSGCSYFQSAANDDEIDLAEVEEEENVENGEVSRVMPRQRPAPAAVENESSLNVGDRFPYSKSVEHRLTQVDQEGTRVSTSRTDVNLTVVVDRILPDGRKLMTVHFQHVRHAQDILGKRIVYSSDATGEPIPQEALLFAGLANNGFSFWIGSNNKILEIVGYGDFLRQCLRNVPEPSRTIVRQQFDPTKGLEGVANYLDESFGLLPLNEDLKHPGTAVAKGAIWELDPRYCDTPIPVVTNTRCILKDLASDSAEILMTGRISGAQDDVVMHDSSGDLKIGIKGGNCTGACRVNPQTGLPVKSQIQRSLELVIELPDGSRIQQNKDTLTTLSLTAEQSPVRSQISDPLFQQTGHQNEKGNAKQRTVVPSGFSRQN